MYEIKAEDVYENFCKDKETFGFSNCLAKSKYYDDSSKLFVSKMRDKAAGVSSKEFVGLKPKMYSFLADYSCEHKKANGNDVNKNVVATISHNEYKDFLLNNKCLRHSMNIIKVKIVEQEPVKSTKFVYHAFMRKYIS